MTASRARQRMKEARIKKGVSGESRAARLVRSFLPSIEGRIGTNADRELPNLYYSLEDLFKASESQSVYDEAVQILITCLELQEYRVVREYMALIIIWDEDEETVSDEDENPLFAAHLDNQARLFREAGRRARL